MLKLVYQFPVLTSRLARATGLMAALAASMVHAEDVVYVDDVQQQAMRSQAVASQRSQYVPAAPSKQSRFPQPTVEGFQQYPQQQPAENEGWSLKKSLSGLFGGNKQESPERTMPFAEPGAATARQGGARPTLFSSGQPTSQQAQQPQAAMRNAVPQRPQSATARQGGFNASTTQRSNKPGGLLSFWGKQEDEPQQQTVPAPCPLMPAGPASVARSTPKPMTSPMPQRQDSDAMVAMVTDREQSGPTMPPTKLPNLPRSAAPSSAPLPMVSTPVVSTDMVRSPLVMPEGLMVQVTGGTLPMGQPITRPAVAVAPASGPQEILNQHAMAVANKPAETRSPVVETPLPVRPSATPVREMPMPVAVATTPAQPARPVATTPSVQFTPPKPTQPANPVAPQQAKAEEPSPRAVELLTEANRMSTEATTEEDFTRVVQLCRHVLAIDTTEVSVAYSHDLASWALNRRGELRTDAGRTEEALLDFNDALRLDPNRYRAIHNRGVLSAQAGRFADAFDDFNRTVELNPEFAKAYSNRAALWVQAGELEKASEDYRQAIGLDPDLAVAHKGRGRVCHMLGQFDLALQHLDAAARLSEGDARIVCSRGDLLLDMGRYRSALADYQQAIQLDGNLSIAYRNLAWLQATCPDRDVRDPQQALVAAKHAMQLCETPGDLEYDTLAAAHAATGDFQSATGMMDKCLELAKEKDKPNYRWRQQLYEKGQAYVTEPASDIQQASFAE